MACSEDGLSATVEVSAHHVMNMGVCGFPGRAPATALDGHQLERRDLGRVGPVFGEFHIGATARGSPGERATTVGGLCDLP